MRSKSDQRPAKRRPIGLGCGYFLLVCFIACILLVLNSGLVWAVYQSQIPKNPELLENEKFLQGIMFSVPVLLIFVEYFVYDLIVDLLTVHRD